MPSGRAETSSVAVYAGAELSVPRLVQAPPDTLRWNSTDCSGRSGSTVAVSATGSIRLTVPPSVGLLMVTWLRGTCVLRADEPRVWPALSSTAAR